MKLGPVIDRLEQNGVVNVQAATDFASLSRAPDRLPATYVIPDSESAAENRMAAGAHDQKVTVDLLVVIVLAGERTSKQTRDKLDEHCDKVQQALIAWAPPGASTPISYIGGRLLSVSGGSLYWGARFRTSYHLRK